MPMLQSLARRSFAACPPEDLPVAGIRDLLAAVQPNRQAPRPPTDIRFGIRQEMTSFLPAPRVEER